MHVYRLDLTQNALNTLSSTSISLLNRLDSEMKFRVYNADVNTINAFTDILDRYKTANSNIKAQYFTKTNKNTLEVEYKGQVNTFSISLKDINEQEISMLIQKMLHKHESWLVFLTGHEEADSFNSGAFGLSGFQELIKESGMRVAELKLLEQQVIPHNVNTLVIANPHTKFTPLEKHLIDEYVADGGNLWIFTEPDSPLDSFLLQEFGVKTLPGVIVDPDSLPLGSPHPAIKLLTTPQVHPISKEIKSPIVMPWSAALQIQQENPRWEYASFIQTTADAWTYTGPETMDIAKMRQNIGITGPLNIGYALQNNKQRILILADSNFITNKFLPIYANRNLVTNMLRWIDSQPIQPQYINHELIDLSYCPSKIERFCFNYLWIFIAPLTLCLIGFCIRARYTKN